MGVIENTILLGPCYYNYYNSKGIVDGLIMLRVNKNMLITGNSLCEMRLSKLGYVLRGLRESEGKTFKYWRRGKEWVGVRDGEVYGKVVNKK